MKASAAQSNRSTSCTCRSSAYVSIRQHTSAYVSIRQHTSEYVSIRQHTSAYVSIRQIKACGAQYKRSTRCTSKRSTNNGRIRQHTSAYVRIRRHTSAYGSTWGTSKRSTNNGSTDSASRSSHIASDVCRRVFCVSICTLVLVIVTLVLVIVKQVNRVPGGGACQGHVRGTHSIRQHTSAYVSIRQHTSAYVSIRQHTSAYVSIHQHTSAYLEEEHVKVTSTEALRRIYRRLRPEREAVAHPHQTLYLHCQRLCAQRMLYKTPASGSIRQHTSAYVSIRQHTSAPTCTASACVRSGCSTPHLLKPLCKRNSSNTSCNSVHLCLGALRPACANCGVSRSVSAGSRAACASASSCARARWRGRWKDDGSLLTLNLSFSPVLSSIQPLLRLY
jgi:hypothetical protein